MHVAISSTEQDLISIGLDKIPPSKWLLDCTPQQQAAWQEIKSDIAKINSELQAYFSGGCYTLSGEDMEDEYWDLVQWYLAFYQLVRVGMSEIRAYAQAHDFPFPYQSPGEVLLGVLQQRAEGSFHYLAKMPYYQHPSRQRYNLRLKSEKLHSSWTEEQDGKKLSAKESRELKDYRRDVKQQNQGLERFAELERLCRQACREHLKTSPSKALRDSLNSCESRKKEADRWFKRAERTERSFVIEHGEIKCGQIGGSYK